jgi:hypothetical protein
MPSRPAIERRSYGPFDIGPGIFWNFHRFFESVRQATRRHCQQRVSGTMIIAQEADAQNLFCPRIPGVITTTSIEETLEPTAEFASPTGTAVVQLSFTRPQLLNASPIPGIFL